MKATSANPTQFVVSDKTWGLAEISVTLPVGWADEKAHGATRIASDLFGQTTAGCAGEVRKKQQTLGCSIEAYASARRTRIVLQSHEDRLLATARLCAEILKDSEPSASDFQRMCARLDSEDRSIVESPEAVADAALRRSLWPGEREGWGPNGNPSQRRPITQSDVLKQWQETLSHPPLITGCGSSESVVQRAVDELVDTFPLYEHQESRLQHPQLSIATTGECVHVPFPGDAEALRLVHALPALSGRQRAIMELLNFALSGGFMGALYHSLRTELHLVYGVRAYPSYRSDDTLWVIETSPSPDKSREVLDALPHAVANLQARLRGVHFESLVDRFLAHHIHRRVSWRARYNAMRLDLEESRPARERARLPERVQKLSSDEVYDFLSRWTEAMDEATIVHVGEQRPSGRIWQRMDLSDIAPSA